MGGVRVRFDVNDAVLREEFVRAGFLEALAPIRDESTALWGRMTAQEMVEHLAWTFRASTGQIEVSCPTPEEKRAPMKAAFLYQNRHTPREYMNPMLAGGLPALCQGSVAEARAALRAEVERFVRDAAAIPDARHTHPIFGPITVEEWWRTHFKHCCHHLQQFGLVELEG